MTELDIRPLRAGDDAPALALHRKSFLPYRSESWWDWRYHGCPGSECTMVGAFTPEGQCLAMFGGVRLPFLLEGEECFVISNGDSAVDADLRRGLSGPRLLRRVSAAFLETFGGGTTKLIFGFPEPPLRRFCYRFRVGEHLTDMLFLVHDLQREPPSPAGIEVRVVQSFSAEADQLWSTCRTEFGAAIVRDERYLNYRFRDHPGVDYDLLEARDARSGALRGIAALREGGWDPAIASLSEWLVPLGDEEAEAALVGEAMRWARRRGRQKLVSWFPAMNGRTRRFQVAYGFYLYPTPYIEIFTAYEIGVDRLWLYEHFYQTMGDIEFF